MHVTIRHSPIPLLFVALSLAIPALAANPAASPLPTDVDEVDSAGSAAQLTNTSKGSIALNPVLPPKWAFGVLFGSYRDQAQLLDAMERLRKDYCGDLLWLDSSWLWNGYNRADRYICFDFDANQFPDPRAMIAALHRNHFKFGVWEWPYIERSITNLYDYGEKHGYFITDQAGGRGQVVSGGGWHGVKFTGQIDFLNPAAADWFMRLNQPLLDMGLDFIKIDTYSTVARGGMTFDGKGSADLRRMYHKTVYDLTAKASRGRGFYLAHRTPTPDNVLYPGMWTGDTRTSWPGFEEDMGRASAMDTPQTAAYWCSDTGGYNGDVPGDELYIRWLEYGCFAPITEFFGAHQTKGRFPWVFGEEAQRIFKFYTGLRYRLLPFRYSNAQICYHETPVKYPVRFVSGATNGIIVGNGDSEILVAPIHSPGATNGLAHLPAGKSWISYWTREEFAGGSAPVVSAPLDKVPLFVKAGSIIPMGPDMAWVDEKPANPLTLDVYPSGKSSYPLYEDDGVSEGYKAGKFSRTLLSCDATGGQIIINIGAAEGEFEGKIPLRTYLVKLNRKVAGPLVVTCGNLPLRPLATLAALDSSNDGWFNDLDAATVWVKLTTPTQTATRIILKAPGL